MNKLCRPPWHWRSHRRHSPCCGLVPVPPAIHLRDTHVLLDQHTPYFTFPMTISPSTSHDGDRDIEAQQGAFQHHRTCYDLMTIRPSHPIFSQAKEGVTRDTSSHQSECDNTTGQNPTRSEPGDIQPSADTQAQHVVDHNPGMWSPM